MDRKENAGRLLLEEIEPDADFCERIELARQGSRRYRPGKTAGRPQVSEREAGKPMRRQMDVFEDTAAGRAATRQAKPRPKEPATPEGAAGKSRGGNAPTGLPLAGPRDATAGTRDRSDRAKGVRRAMAGRIRHGPGDRPEKAGAIDKRGG